MKAYWGQPIENGEVPPAGFIPWRGLIFPHQHPAALKMAGVTQDKIRFFSKAYRIQNEAHLARVITDTKYGGDLLFLSSLSAGSGPPEWPDDLPLSTSQQLDLPYRVEHFDSNNLEISVTIPGSKPAWMFYSDVWHPGWRATVNHQPMPVYRANLAYKAVSLQAGSNRVRLTFKNKEVEWFYYFFSLSALAWLILLMVFLGKILFNGEENRGGKAVRR